MSFLYRIAIWMYWNEGVHAPTIHARHAGQAASIDLEGELIAGELPRRARARRRMDGAAPRRAVRDWERARRNEPLEPIDPLA
jgi:hypothetical protein